MLLQATLISPCFLDSCAEYSWHLEETSRVFWYCVPPLPFFIISAFYPTKFPSCFRSTGIQITVYPTIITDKAAHKPFYANITPQKQMPASLRANPIIVIVSRSQPFIFLPPYSAAMLPPCGWLRGYAGRCHSGRYYPPWPHQCRHRLVLYFA